MSYIASFPAFFYHGATAPPQSGPRPPHYRGFTITIRHTTVGRTPLDELSARRTDLYLTTHNTHNSQTPVTPEGFEPTIPASERPQTDALDRAATGIGFPALYFTKYSYFHLPSQYSDSLRLLPSCNVNTFYSFLFLVKVQTLCNKILLYPPLRREDHRLSVA